ncbi:primosomal protein DnaI [Anaerobacillus isosaccharinicus]|uniref:Primosomal protein DnaI n=2 Tax=Anaerobacillus isosaccharinicus TaxID=1532552 RepID=A0A7S7R9K8_9BACI|nr:primosomal protein DnaI [Anaerobacillus isosaccharinicus]MBA5587914.1 primosomal protein DnaI [Anaerobacillus isosaccharinicus]QOY33935.1 primosomal protein DnaI [Anaerobacillus isosaccharinicus]
MESIQQTFQKMKNSKSILGHFERLKEDVLSDKWVNEFITANPELPESELDRNISRLFEFRNERKNCSICMSLQSCPNMMKGYQPELYVERQQVQIRYNVCQKKLKADESKRQHSLIKSLFIPKEILAATFDQLDQDNRSRIVAIAKAVEFATTTTPGETGKGLYLHGKFGVGKTYIMGAIANELAERNISTMLVYTPDFFRELKSGIHDGSYNVKLDLVKKVPVLILDDLGAETMSSWVRDDILGVILQHRMLEKLPTLYTSNYDFDELEEHLAYSQKGGIEQLKSKRIMERIRHFAEPVFIEGENRRGM